MSYSNLSRAGGGPVKQVYWAHPSLLRTYKYHKAVEWLKASDVETRDCEIAEYLTRILAMAVEGSEIERMAIAALEALAHRG